MRLAAHPLAEMREYGELMLVELRKVIPAFLKRVDVEDRGVAWSRYWRRHARGRRGARPAMLADAASSPEHRDEVTLVDFDPDGEAKVAAAVLYASTGLPDDQLLALARAMTARASASRAPRRASATARTAGTSPAARGSAPSYRFDVLCDYGAFRDLQRHRPLTIEWQRLTTEHGYETPPQIDEAGLREEWERVMRRERRDGARAARRRLREPRSTRCRWPTASVS